MVKRIVVDPKIMVGKPIIKGARVPVSLVLNLVKNGYNAKRICEAYPNLTPKDVEAALDYSEKLISRETVFEPTKVSYAKTSS
ncbi:antitoxin [candidate division WWE3 bacterium CG_4_10_14_0_2_um_filter_42_7]|uniref:Antitoxin n=2 Tax=Katanobacteria TaxID=422282 RepID=A0A2H0X957_UNCKA|nr:MAG: antitoxin [candidate division WWE3 bacterium CG08_land_8_20_14_0_20_41_15]PIZ42901.1 MAG: antitoxin [candidate division WWE3 bacterium CG_4_10_14_0_2_um_filter_42_7]